MLTDGHYKCICNEGYFGNGKICVQVYGIKNDTVCDGIVYDYKCYKSDCCEYRAFCLMNRVISFDANDGKLCKDGIFVDKSECENIKCDNGKCGDGICDVAERGLCDEDCGQAPFCGDGICNEDINNCYNDCGRVEMCGDGICDYNEHFGSCFECDGENYCGDGVCNENEDLNNCFSDCFIPTTVEPTTTTPEPTTTPKPTTTTPEPTTTTTPEPTKTIPDTKTTTTPETKTTTPEMKPESTTTIQIIVDPTTNEYVLPDYPHDGSLSSLLIQIIISDTPRQELNENEKEGIKQSISNIFNKYGVSLNMSLNVDNSNSEQMRISMEISSYKYSISSLEYVSNKLVNNPTLLLREIQRIFPNEEFGSIDIKSITITGIVQDDKSYMDSIIIYIFCLILLLL